MRRHIIADTASKDFSYLLPDQKAARKLGRAARSARGAGRGGRIGRTFRPGTFNPDAEDRDADGMVQDGTRFERVAKPSTPGSRGRGTKPGRQKPVSSAITETDELQLPNSPKKKPNLESPGGRGVPVRQPGQDEESKKKKAEREEKERQRLAEGNKPTSRPPRKPTRKELRDERRRLRAAGQPIPRIGQRLFTDYTESQRQVMLNMIEDRLPFLQAWMNEEGIEGTDDRMRFAMGWFRRNSEDSLRRSGMVDENGNLTDDARVAQKWYDIAHDLSNEVAQEIGVQREAAYAVMAIFSASTAWDINVPASIAVMKRFKDNPVLDEDYALEVYKYRLSSITENLKTKLNNTKFPPKEKAGLIARLRAGGTLTDDDKEKLGVMAYEKVLQGEELTKEDEKWLSSYNPVAHQKVKDLIEIVNSEPIGYVTNIMGGRLGDRLQDQDAKFGGYMMKLAETTGFDGGPIKAIEFDVLPDGSYSAKYTDLDAVTAHSPEVVHAKAFRILKAASAGNIDMAELMSMIDENLGEGAKIRSFYNNIADPRDTRFQSGTIDTHIGANHLNIPFGSGAEIFKEGLFSTPNPALGLPRLYAVFNEVLFEMAQEYGLTNREMQSIVWEAQRKIWNWAKGDAPKARTSKRIVEWIKERSSGDAKKQNAAANFTEQELRDIVRVIADEEFANEKPRSRKKYTGDDFGLLPPSIPRN